MAILLPGNRADFATTFVQVMIDNPSLEGITAGLEMKCCYLSDLPIPEDAYVLWKYNSEADVAYTFRRDEVEWTDDIEGNWPLQIKNGAAMSHVLKGSTYIDGPFDRPIRVSDRVFARLQKLSNKNRSKQNQTNR